MMLIRLCLLVALAGFLATPQAFAQANMNGADWVAGYV
jgi:hypothetical protein